MKDTHKTIVIFRKWKDDKEIIALFPEEESSIHSGEVTSYMHIGQHSGADYSGVIEQTTLATPEEYSDLKQELESIGYNLTIRKKQTAYYYRKKSVEA